MSLEKQLQERSGLGRAKSLILLVREGVYGLQNWVGSGGESVTEELHCDPHWRVLEIPALQSSSRGDWMLLSAIFREIHPRSEIWVQDEVVMVRT